MSIFSFVKSHAVLAGSIGIVVVAGSIIASRAATKQQAEAPAPQARNVTLVDVATFRMGTSTVAADGTIEASSQADLKAQISGQISAIHLGIGDRVAAGQAILELSNADLRAQLQSAQAALSIAESQYGSTRQSAIDRVHDAYLAGDSAVHSSIDQLILNTSQQQPQLFSYVTDQTLASKIRDERSDLTTRFVTWQASVNALSATSTDDNIHSAIVLSENDLDLITILLDSITKALNGTANVALTQSLPAINAIQSTVATARQSVTGAKTSLISTEASLVGSAMTGGSAAQASVTVAESTVQNIQAVLAKTVIASPIAGKVSALPLNTGEFAAPGTLLATVVGGDSLIAKAFVSATDIGRIAPGAAVSIENGARGTVTNVSPSVSADTKTGEVDIAITGSGMGSSPASLVVGQNVHVSIAARQQASVSGVEATSSADAYILPIQDVKIVPGAAYVYTVDDSSKLVQDPVTLGPVDGDFITVVGGLSDGMQIATPVYELEEGQQVTAQ